ncbi:MULTISPECIES: NAD(P)/FAD-dependent oxidoreductase [Cyanophyceae]|uniref:NAD(P)/FAD-dependent oxidoreductase n=1 Tax=Cyanophyceae TaxID=3028117 RepID=UPI00232EF2EE|nr:MULTISPECIES: FAD-binding oxidoreductase [Cyanophyceae]MDB9355070.1 FAD-binding oxidoreductase [Nodularia spumigena CS-587/03]MDB9304875.1 FAD-binding oxidoreductase [Nodularia spumigena CS-591/12]MDB9320495.1 FAD-binding oxidoreductase [Nodularia spumigena CS-591/07A]MDB9338844.1 FAD-binding oxidoreductase [Nodularia spumigena CS-589/07]MDB9346220.1 FAD-binding oxidoreductase [Nodularia spumigena CS-588/01]
MSPSLTEKILSQLPGDVLGGLRQGDRLLESIRENTAPVPTVVKESQQPLDAVDWDVIVCGGTLGILIACALAVKGRRVALMERGILRGREQEWNISRPELEVFVELNLLSIEELEQAIATKYNPARVSFAGGAEIWVEDVLNIGVDPVYLLETLKTRFLAAGGNLLENTPFTEAIIHPEGIIVNNQYKTRLLIDAMGNFSPITRQARQGKKPDALCLVVGTCAQGFPENTSGDLLFSFTPLENQCQYFWEAFPAKDGRTTYLFTYMDAEPQRLTLAALFEEYLRLLPEYQGVELNQLQFQRALFGFFPSYRQSPIKTPWNRLLTVGDSSGSQSPLSFGGFGAMVRHLKRLTFGIHEALQSEQLSAQNLALLQPYQPNLTVTWLFQKAMSVGVNQKIPPEQINQLLKAVFQEMQQLGTPVLKPFLQDVVQFSGLTQTLLKTGLFHPLLVAKIIPQVGLLSLLDWLVHYGNLGIYTGLLKLSPILETWIKTQPSQQQYYWHRLVDAWKYGSGGDYFEA